MEMENVSDRDLDDMILQNYCKEFGIDSRERLIKSSSKIDINVVSKPWYPCKNRLVSRKIENYLSKIAGVHKTLEREIRSVWTDVGFEGFLKVLSNLSNVEGIKFLNVSNEDLLKISTVSNEFVYWLNANESISIGDSGIMKYLRKNDYGRVDCIVNKF